MGKFIITETVSYEVEAPDVHQAHGLAHKNLCLDLDRIMRGEMSAVDVFDSKCTAIVL